MALQKGVKRPRAATIGGVQTPYVVKVVGAIGFEPTTYGTQNRRATRLRHAPTACLLAPLFTDEKSAIALLLRFTGP